MQEIVCGANQAAKTVESFLRNQFPIGYVRKVFRKNAVRVNGRRARPDDVIRTGDRIQLYILFAPDNQGVVPKARSAPFEILFADDALLVVDKPAGLAVHEGKTVSKKNSLLGILEVKYRGRGMRPQLVHRLDRDTSGVLIIAKNPEIAADIKSRFESGDVDKEYLCLVVGRMPNNEGKIDLPLPGRDGSPVRALTLYRVAKRFSDTTLMRVRIETGRLHQIRLHFAMIDHPVVMDDQHGDFGFNKRFRKKYGLKRQFLHAEKLKIKIADQRREWTAPLAQDLRDIVKLLSAEQR